MLMYKVHLKKSDSHEKIFLNKAYKQTGGTKDKNIF